MRIPAWMILLGASAIIAIGSSLGLVYVADHNQRGLVRGDYYEAGVRLDEQRLREARFDSLDFDLELIEQANGLVVKNHAVNKAARERMRSYRLSLELQRPDDPGADRKLNLEPNSLSSSDTTLRWSIQRRRCVKADGIAV